VGYDLVRSDSDAESVNIFGWHLALTLAHMGGWQPAGAQPAPHAHLLSRPPDYYDGRFDDSDARAFAQGLLHALERGLLPAALERAEEQPSGIMLSMQAAVADCTFALPGGELDLRMREIASFAERGSFWVGL
jgi:hypothetical protein